MRIALFWSICQLRLQLRRNNKCRRMFVEELSLHGTALRTESTKPLSDSAMESLLLKRAALKLDY